MNRRKFGMIGEKIAQGYLKDDDYEIIDTNFYTKVGEIDIICKKNNTIVFVEVKTKTGFEYGTPAMAVDKNKKAHIKQTAKVYIHLNKLYNYEIEFDVIEVIIMNGKCKVNHLKQVM